MRYRLFIASCLLVFVAVGVGCGGWTRIEDYPCPNPDGTTKVTYKNFVKGFLDTWCNKCHASSSKSRRGAPITYIFDAYEIVLTVKQRIFIRSADKNTTMPPGPDDPPEADRKKLAEWIVCGSPRE